MFINFKLINDKNYSSWTDKQKLHVVQKHPSYTLALPARRGVRSKAFCPSSPFGKGKSVWGKKLKRVKRIAHDTAIFRNQPIHSVTTTAYFLLFSNILVFYVAFIRMLKFSDVNNSINKHSWIKHQCQHRTTPWRGVFKNEDEWGSGVKPTYSLTSTRDKMLAVCNTSLAISPLWKKLSVTFGHLVSRLSNVSDLHSGRPWFGSRPGSPSFWVGTINWAMPTSFQTFFSSLPTIIQSCHYIRKAWVTDGVVQSTTHK